MGLIMDHLQLILRRGCVPLLVVLGVFGCGGSEGVSADETGPGTATAGGETSGPSPTNPALAAGLDSLCRNAEAAAADSSRSLEVQFDLMQEGVEAEGHGAVVGEFIDAHEGDRERDEVYVALVQAAEAEGVPGWSCPTLEAMLDRYAEVEGGHPAEPEASALEDFDRWCLIAREVTADERLDPLTRGMVMGQRLDLELSNPEVREVVEAVIRASAEDSYPLILEAAAELGAPGFECPALAAYFAGG
jgi:hypothetical protein